MDRRSGVKTVIEQIHLDYLCKQFDVRRAQSFPLNGGVFHADLEGTNQNTGCLLEVKTKTFPKKQQRQPPLPYSSFGWWTLNTGQIGRYEHVAKQEDLQLAWMFVVGHTAREVTQLPQLNERAIRQRDMFVVPWEAYTLVDATMANQRYIGLSRLRREYDFEERAVHKGTLAIAREVRELFDFSGN